MSFHPVGAWRSGLALILLAVAPEVQAQEVTVGAPVWLSSDPAPDVMPRSRRSVKPDYPDEMRKTAETGYVIVQRYVDASGQNRSLGAAGTHVAFQRAVEAEFYDWKMAPASRGGVAVDALFWMPIIFNPKSAAKETPDRAPRLLAVAPIILPGETDLPSGMPREVPVRLSLDASGAIVGMVPKFQLPEKLLDAVTEALKNWRFAPAMRSGLPVAAEITLPVLFCQPPGAMHAGKRTPPKVIDRVNPSFPLVLERFGIKGQVQVEFTIDKEGRVQNPIIVKSDNPAFDEPALEALLQWKFQPATVDGQKVDTQAKQILAFQPWEDGDKGKNIFNVRDRVDQSKLPPELRYDVAVKIIGVQMPVYPYALRREGTQGKARATMLINQQGRVSAVKVQSATHPEFGLALAAALEGFTFDPALKDGKPVQHLLNFEQIFSDSELPDKESARLLAWEKKQSDKITGAEKLDGPLKPVSRRPPLFPRSEVDAVATGDALIECLIDEKGRVRLPRVITASAPAFGYAAVQAVATWWFEPPRKEGKPVVTRARIPFRFKLEVPDPTPTKQP